MVKLSPVFRCATYGLRVAASMIQTPCSRPNAVKVVPVESDPTSYTPCSPLAPHFALVKSSKMPLESTLQLTIACLASPDRVLPARVTVDLVH